MKNVDLAKLEFEEKHPTDKRSRAAINADENYTRKRCLDGIHNHRKRYSNHKWVKAQERAGIISKELLHQIRVGDFDFLDRLFGIRDALRILYGYGYINAELLKEVEAGIELKIR